MTNDALRHFIFACLSSAASLLPCHHPNMTSPKATKSKKLVFLLLFVHFANSFDPEKISFRREPTDDQLTCGLGLRMLSVAYIGPGHSHSSFGWNICGDIKNDIISLSSFVPFLRIYGFPNVDVYVFALSTSIPSKCQECSLSLCLSFAGWWRQYRKAWNENAIVISFLLYLLSTEGKRS